MFLSKVKIWNFRKYGIDNDEAGIEINLNEGLNVIVGENDSGKTTIVDAIKLVLGTQSYDTIRVEENDFYKDSNGIRAEWLKIECHFEKLSDLEAGRFLEWIYFDVEGKPVLDVRLIARIKDDNRIIIRKTGGKDGVDITFNASEYLRVTYLKPLRDAEHELSPGYRSRFAQVLKCHPVFRKTTEKHKLENIMESANKSIEDYFKESIPQGNESKEGTQEEKDEQNEKSTNDNAAIITKSITSTLENFLGSNKEKYNVNINISEMELHKILARLMLKIGDDKVGLGTLNQLYMAMELLLLDIKEQNNEFGLALIEEIEAHIHPQAQLRIIKHLAENIGSQTILTTHSNTLASVVNIDSLILCKDGNAYSLNRRYTRLSSGDYEFLERFLDSTKANLFFAKGVIMVEGDAENILVPTIAKILDRPLHKYGVSVVNVGNIAFLRYSNIFISKDETKTLGIPVSIITDLDVRPQQYYIDKYGSDLSKYKKHTIYIVKGIDKKFIKLDEAKKCVRDILGEDRLSDEVYANQIITILDDYCMYKTLVKENKKKKYNFKDIHLFTNEWTMEFDLALSCIRDYLYASILIAQEIQKDEGTIDVIQQDNTQIDVFISDAKQSISGFISKSLSKMDIAFEIYRPLLEKKASKAVTAQYLSRILLDKVDTNEMKNKIKEDQYIKYITKAIYHVTENGGAHEE